MDEATEFSPAQAADPSTPGEVLAAIAGSRPDLRPYIAANPAAYPGLLDWLGQLGDPAVDGALRARAAAQPAPAYEQPAPYEQQQEPEPVAGGADLTAATGGEPGSAETPSGGEAPAVGEAPVSGEAATSPYGEPSGGFAAPTAYVPPAASGGDAFGVQPQGDSGQTPYGAPAEYGAQPYGAAPGGPYVPPGGQPPKKSKTWLWVLLALLGVVIIGGIVIAILIFNLANRAANDVDGIFNTGDATSYGDSAELDALWDDCADGEMSACDTLFNDSPLGSDYERFGDTCGDRTDGGQWCRDLPIDGGAAAPDEPPASTEGDPVNYGDDATLDALWDGCEGGDMDACDDLYRDSPVGSDYEDFGDSCGGRTDGGTWCSATD